MVCLSLLHYPLITYPNGYADWVVGSLAKKGTGTRWIDSVGQGGFKCPFEISYTNWKLWYGGQWNSGDGVSFTLESVQDFLIKLDMKQCMHLVEISIFSLNLKSLSDLPKL